MTGNVARQALVALSLGSWLLWAGCSTAHYRRSADKEVAGVIREKTPLVPNMDPHFTIETNGPPALEGLPVNERVEEALGPEGDFEKGARILSLNKALELAVRHSRSYQRQKEALYLEALSLTLVRHNTPPLVPRARPHPKDIKVGVDNVVENRNFTASGGTTFESLLWTGGRIVTDFSLDFSRFLTGNPQAALSSAMSVTLVQPLLRGAGYRVAVENLTQAERNMLYRIREFTQQRKDFAISIARAYYGVLQNRDKMRNSWRGLVNYRRNVARDQAFVQEGLRAQAQLDELRQAELSNESAWIGAVRSYKDSLDKFKLTLGLPLSAHLVLDDGELERLNIVHPPITIEEAVKVAEASRLDLHSEKERLEDAERKVKLAANNLLPQLDVTAKVEFPDQPGNKGLPDFGNPRWTASPNLTLPLDRKADRNSYRAVLIAHQQAQRGYEEKLDNVRLEIVNGWRGLDEAKRSHEISLMGVKVSERRVEEQTLRAELGRGTARELVAAQDDLTKSKDSLTSALIGHTLARLTFWSNMGVLMIKDNGQWEDMADARPK